MDREKLRALWQQEEQAAFQGWDFSRLAGRVLSDNPGWDYRQEVLAHLQPGDRLLDMGTGGGEFLLSLRHPYRLTSVTEGYAPNLALCRERLSPLGIDVLEVEDDDGLPFADNSFDTIINRHDSFDPAELYRCMRPGAHFITQQVGGQNTLALSRRLIPDYIPQYPEHDLRHKVSLLEKAGLQVLRQLESFPPLRFLDVGALVYHARQLPWEFPGFSVDACFERLLQCQAELEEQGSLTALEHRFLIVARKPG